MLSFDPHGLVMDYHSIGFRECASEVARYLVGFEGLDIQDPLRLRLMSHLQCFSAQRDLALKSPPAPHQVSPPPPPPTNPWFVVPTPHYPLLHTHSTRSSSTLGYSTSSSSSASDRRPSSNSSSMSVDTSGGSSPKARSHLTSPVMSYVGPPFRRSTTLESEGKVQRSPVMPYRPWGAEVAY